MAARQRLPGFLQGQIYSYPSKRWRKKRRQYLTSFLQPRRGTVMPPKEAGDEAGEHFHTISTVENPAAVSAANDDASKDSMKDDPKVSLPEKITCCHSEETLYLHCHVHTNFWHCLRTGTLMKMTCSIWRALMSQTLTRITIMKNPTEKRKNEVPNPLGHLQILLTTKNPKWEH